MLNYELNGDDIGVETTKKDKSMGDIIQFPTRDKNKRITKKLVNIADEIDSVILKNLKDGDIETRDLVGILSHRLGHLISHLEGKSEIWDVCEQVLKRQAQID